MGHSKTEKEDLNLIQAALESFPWESKEQEEGFLNFVQYLRKFGLQMELPITNYQNLIAFYFIQKDIDSNAYWRDLVSNQVQDLQNQIASLIEEKENLAALVKSQGQTIDSFLLNLNKK